MLSFEGRSIFICSLTSLRFGSKIEELNIDSRRNNSNKQNTKKRKRSSHHHPQRNRRDLPPKQHLSN